MNKPKYQIGDRNLENEEDKLKNEEDEIDWKAVDHGFCPYCHSELEFCLTGNLGDEYCEMCGMDI